METVYRGVEVAIHSKDNLSNLEKFTYLKGFLKDTALSTIEGFPLTNHNYTNALELLRQRYGNTQLIISMHMNDLIKIGKVSNHNNILDLRNMYDNIESNVRALKGEGINPLHFGASAVPNILEKLPSSIQLHVSQSLGKDNWDMEEFLKCVNEEITARESCEFLKARDEPKEKTSNYTSSSLMVKSREIKCVFCGMKHYNDKCDTVIDIDARVEILKSSKLCFNCLKRNHQKRDCRKQVQCYACKRES